MDMSLGLFWGTRLCADAMLCLAKNAPEVYAIRLAVPISLSSLFFRRPHRNKQVKAVYFRRVRVLRTSMQEVSVHPREAPC